MQRWEYIEFYTNVDSVAAINGTGIPQPKPRAHEYLNHLGEKGWELVGFAAYPGKEHYVLKRLK